jgi:hypothetical protein
MAHIESYIERSGPVVGLHTSTHAFKFADHARNVKPSDLAGWDTPIMPDPDVGKPGK